MAISVIPAIATVWWLRPDNSAARVGEQIAVVWKRVYCNPFAASRSNVGVSHGPPNTDDAPNPTSSISTTNTFGAPAGGRHGRIGENRASSLLASNEIDPAYGRSGIGNTARGGSNGSGMGGSFDTNSGVHEP